MIFFLRSPSPFFEVPPLFPQRVGVSISTSSFWAYKIGDLFFKEHFSPPPFPNCPSWLFKIGSLLPLSPMTLFLFPGGEYFLPLADFPRAAFFLLGSPFRTATPRREALFCLLLDFHLVNNFFLGDVERILSALLLRSFDS